MKTSKVKINLKENKKLRFLRYKNCIDRVEGIGLSKETKKNKQKLQDKVEKLEVILGIKLKE